MPLADNVQMVFTTGGAFTSRARQFLREVPNPRLDKPFDARKFRLLIGDLVARSRARIHLP